MCSESPAGIASPGRCGGRRARGQAPEVERGEQPVLPYDARKRDHPCPEGPGVIKLQAVDVRRCDGGAVRHGHRPGEAAAHDDGRRLDGLRHDEVEPRRRAGRRRGNRRSGVGGGGGGGGGVGGWGGVPLRVFVNVQTATSPCATAPSTLVPGTETRTVPFRAHSTFGSYVASSFPQPRSRSLSPHRYPSGVGRSSSRCHLSRPPLR